MSHQIRNCLNFSRQELQLKCLMQKEHKKKNATFTRVVCPFLPASVVPLDMDELRDSVVSGRFNAVSSEMGEAADGPAGLRARGRKGRKETGSRKN